VTDDGTSEADESFKITLSNSTQPEVTIGTSVHTASIINDDVPGSNIYYVRKTGNDGNDGLTPATAWLTIGQAASTLGASDRVFVGAGTYSESVSPANSGTVTDQVYYYADTDGTNTGDSGAVIVSSAGNVWDISGVSYVVIDGFEITGGTNGIRASTSASNVTFRNLEIYSNTIGISLGNGTSSTVTDALVENCQIDSNSSHGIYVYRASSPQTFYNNLIFANGGDGIYIERQVNAEYYFNTIDNNTGSGLVFARQNVITATHNVITNNDIGMEDAFGDTVETNNYNNVYGNSTDYDTVTAGANSISVDPSYTNTGTGDYTVSVTSGINDVGQNNATTYSGSDGSTMADRYNRSDAVNDGNTAGGDGLKVNMGFHY